MPLVQPPAYGANVCMHFQEGKRLFGPAAEKFAVSIHELHVQEIGRYFPYAPETSVACASCGKRDGHIQLDHFCAMIKGQLRRPIGRAGVNIH